MGAVPSGKDLKASILKYQLNPNFEEILKELYQAKGKYHTFLFMLGS